MYYLVVFCAFLFTVRHAGVRAQTAIWKFPTSGDNLQANTVDTVLLDWTSTLPSTILRMWCKNGTDGDNFALASSFDVDATGPFKYVLETYDGGETSFPLSCHAELAEDPLGSGFDSPAGIVWSSNSAQVAKTISQTQPPSSVTVTVIPTPSLSSTSKLTTSLTDATALPSSTTNPNPSQASTTRSTTTNSTNLTASTQQSVVISTKGSGDPSSATAVPQQSISASSSSNNTGAIVGGVIGSVALLSFVILALLFLRKHQRDHASASPIATVPSKKGFYIFNLYKKRGPRARTTGIFEKEGDDGAYEKEGNSVLYQEQAHEVQGSTVWRKTMLRAGNWIGKSESREMHCNPVELPGDLNNFL